jgi:hypothetical protein
VVGGLVGVEEARDGSSKRRDSWRLTAARALSIRCHGDPTQSQTLRTAENYIVRSAGWITRWVIFPILGGAMGFLATGKHRFLGPRGFLANLAVSLPLQPAVGSSNLA